MRSMTVHRHSEWRPQFVRILRLGGPLVVNNLAVAGMGFADAVMAGRLGAESLAAVAVGGSNGVKLPTLPVSKVQRRQVC